MEHGIKAFFLILLQLVDNKYIALQRYYGKYLTFIQNNIVSF